MKRPELGPDQCRFYPPEWQYILEKSRFDYRLHIAANCAFPERQPDMQIPFDILGQEIAAYQAEKPNRKIPEGKSLH
jgi:hypothetical protein